MLECECERAIISSLLGMRIRKMNAMALCSIERRNGRIRLAVSGVAEVPLGSPTAGVLAGPQDPIGKFLLAQLDRALKTRFHSPGFKEQSWCVAFLLSHLRWQKGRVDS